MTANAGVSIPTCVGQSGQKMLGTNRRQAIPKSLVQRSAENPILRPSDCKPSRGDMVVECLLNPGAFCFKDRTGLLIRVAERPVQEKGWVSTPVVDPEAEGGVRVVRFRKGDPKLVCGDSRGLSYDGSTYLTTLSHLRLAWSDDGIRFTIDPMPTIVGQGPLETFGCEDCRVTQIGGRYLLTYTAVSPAGHGVGLISTRDWRRFQRHGMILPTPNKDCAIFPEKIGGEYYALHRPSGMGIGGNYMWTAQSPDLLHWGNHRCLAMTRADHWDEARIGAGAAPIRTEAGWLQIYHGADRASRYCLGLLLMDAKDPGRVLARSDQPIMKPDAAYEKTGFFGNVVFTNGHVVRGDEILMYYGASDEVVCAAKLSIKALLRSLRTSAT